MRCGRDIQTVASPTMTRPVPSRANYHLDRCNVFLRCLCSARGTTIAPLCGVRPAQPRFPRRKNSIPDCATVLRLQAHRLLSRARHSSPKPETLQQRCELMFSKFQMNCSRKNAVAGQIRVWLNDRTPNAFGVRDTESDQ